MGRQKKKELHMKKITGKFSGEWKYYDMQGRLKKYRIF